PKGSGKEAGEMIVKGCVDMLPASLFEKGEFFFALVKRYSLIQQNVLAWKVNVMSEYERALLERRRLYQRVPSGTGKITTANYKSLAKSSEKPPEMWLSEFALRFASAPHTLRQWAGGDFQKGLDCLYKLPTLARLARFFVLAIDG